MARITFIVVRATRERPSTRVDDSEMSGPGVVEVTEEGKSGEKETRLLRSFDSNFDHMSWHGALAWHTASSAL